MVRCSWQFLHMFTTVQCSDPLDLCHMAKFRWQSLQMCALSYGKVCWQFLQKAISLNIVLMFLFLQSKQHDVEWLLRVVLRTLEKASSYRMLFQYVPEFYIESCIHAFNALRNYFNTTQPFDTLPSKSCCWSPRPGVGVLLCHYLLEEFENLYCAQPPRFWGGGDPEIKFTAAVNLEVSKVLSFFKILE